MKGNLSWTYLKNAALLTELNALVRSRGDQYPVWMSLIRLLIPCTMFFQSPPGMPTTLQTAQGECARELFLEVAHDGRADELVEDGTYDNGSYYATIFLGYWNQPSTKEVWSEVHLDELVVGSCPLFAQLTDGIDSL